MSLLAARARSADDRPVATIILLLLAGCAWLALIVWGASPYARYLDHRTLGDISRFDAPLGLGLAVIGWVLMILAMMLPTVLPLVNLFRRMVQPRPDRGWLIGLLIAGYLVIWSAFGIAIHISDLGIHQLVDQIAWLSRHTWVVGTATILLAGVYQFSPLKYHCLDKCRSPLSFISEQWKGGNAGAQAFRLGLHHGLFCIGCCWTLMLLMFAVGMGNIAWMLALGAVMAIEKNLPWGRRLSAPLGLTLATLGAGIAVFGLAGGI